MSTRLLFSLSNLAASNSTDTEKAKENKEWRALNEPCLVALEVESSSKSSCLEDLEREKKRLEVEVATLKETLAKYEGKVLELEASNVGLNTAHH